MKLAAWCAEMGDHLHDGQPAIAEWFDLFSRADRCVYVGLVGEGVVETREALKASTIVRNVLVRGPGKHDVDFLTVRRTYRVTQSPPPELVAGLMHASDMRAQPDR